MKAFINKQWTNKLIQNAYLLVFIRVLAAGSGFLFWVIAARNINAYNVGLASGIVSASVLLAGIAQLGLGYGLVRHLAKSDKPNELLSLSIAVSGLVSLGLALFFLLGLPQWSPELLPMQASLRTVLLFILLVLSTALSQLLNWAFLAMRQLTFTLIKQTAHALLAITLLFLLRSVTANYVAVVTAYTAATLISAGISFVWLLPRAQPGFKFKLGFQVLSHTPFARFAMVNYVTDQFQRAPDSLLPLIVIHLFGPESGAYFYVAWLMGRSVTAWANSIAESLFAEGSNSPGLAATYVWKAIKIGLLLAGGLSLILSLGGKLILSYYGQDYAENGVLLLYFAAFSAIPGVLLSIFVSFLRIRDRLRGVFVIVALSNGFGILLSYAGMFWFGFVGAGIGWLASQLLVLLGLSGWWLWQHPHWRRNLVMVTVPAVGQVNQSNLE